MKAILLAGDSGNRLHPVTLGIPKQLIPIYDKPMVYYPIETLVNAGITDILVITSSEYLSSFQKSIGNYLGAKFSYTVQDNANGIAEALIIGKQFFDKEGVCLITGDTIISGESVTNLIKKAIRSVTKSGNATIFVEDKAYPDQYGKVIVDKYRKVADISGEYKIGHYYSITGLYVFPQSVKKYLDSLQVSERGLIEVIDLHKKFFQDLKLQIKILDKNCVWWDTNTFENILKCGEYMYNQTKKIH